MKRNIDFPRFFPILPGVLSYGRDIGVYCEVGERAFAEDNSADAVTTTWNWRGKQCIDRRHTICVGESSTHNDV